MSTHAKKSEQLGIPYGTANARLQRMILFKLLVDTKQNICYQCGKVINTVGDLSIEHKQPWLNKDIKLFWDLDNIAFSHLDCNRNASTNKGIGRSTRKVGPKDTAWCTNHKGFSSINEFTRNARNWNGLDSECITCRKIRRMAT